jgi:hypothetical protein
MLNSIITGDFANLSPSELTEVYKSIISKKIKRELIFSLKHDIVSLLIASPSAINEMPEELINRYLGIISNNINRLILEHKLEITNMNLFNKLKAYIDLNSCMNQISKWNIIEHIFTQFSDRKKVLENLIYSSAPLSDEFIIKYKVWGAFPERFADNHVIGANLLQVMINREGVPVDSFLFTYFNKYKRPCKLTIGSINYLCEYLLENFNNLMTPGIFAYIVKYYTVNEALLRNILIKCKDEFVYIEVIKSQILSFNFINELIPERFSTQVITYQRCIDEDKCYHMMANHRIDIDFFIENGNLSKYKRLMQMLISNNDSEKIENNIKKCIEQNRVIHNKEFIKKNKLRVAGTISSLSKQFVINESTIFSNDYIIL